jgi:hypothetical protein
MVVAGHQKSFGVDAEVSGVPGVVLEWLQVVGGIGSILDGIYRDKMMVAGPRSSVEMQGHD